MGEGLDQGEASEQVMPLEQYAAVTALIDAGRPRDEVLEGVGLSPQAWMAAQTHWLLIMAEQARLDRFELQNRFNDLLLGHLEAIEAGAAPLAEAGGVAPGEGGAPALGKGGAVAPELPDGRPAPVVPPPVVPQAMATPGAPPPVVTGVAAGAASDSPSAASPWSDGSAPVAMQPLPVTGRRKMTTLSPFAAVAAPMMGRAVRSEGDGVLPFEPPPMPAQGAPPSVRVGDSAAEPQRVVVERPFVLPFSTATPGTTTEPSVGCTLPLDEAAPASAVLPFVGPPARPQPGGDGPAGPLPFASAAGPGAAQASPAPAVSATAPPAPAVSATAPPTSVAAALPFEPAPVPSEPRPAASPPASVGVPVLPFQTPGAEPPESVRTAGPPVPPAGPPPPAVEPPPPSVPSPTPPPAAPAPPPKPPKDGPVDLGSTMHVDAGDVPKFVLPFAGSDQGGDSQPKRPAGELSADGALPFQSQQATTGDGDGQDPEGLAGTVAVAAGVRLETGQPRLSLEQFASLSAEIAVHPEQRSTIEQRYGLDGAGHDREKGAWAVAFLNDPATAQAYREKLSAFRAWLERKGSGS